MADETEINGKFFDDLSVEVAGYESPPKIWSVNQRISDLEEENDSIIRENEEYKKRIEDLKASMKELSAENAGLKKQVDKLQTENTAAAVVVARAAELETEVSRLQHDLVSAMSDLQGSAVEVLDLKRDLEGMRSREKEKSVKLEAMGKEKALLMSKVEKLERVESGLRVELMEKEREIQLLKNNVEELEVVVGNSKSLETMKNELETQIVLMKAEIISLESSLDEKDKVISSLETKERAILDTINVDNKGLIGGSKQWDWLVAGGSTIAAVAALSVACYVRAARRH
ncbi:hypothetical protein ACS0TY_017238 [Phlomoides rotata]